MKVENLLEQGEFFNFFKGNKSIAEKEFVNIVAAIWLWYPKVVLIDVFCDAILRVQIMALFYSPDSRLLP